MRKKLEVTLENSPGLEEKIEVEGKKIPFKKVANKLLDYCKDNGGSDSLKITGVRYSERKRISESPYSLFAGTDFDNLKEAWIEQHIPYLSKDEFYKAVRELTKGKENNENFRREIKVETNLRYKRDKWGGVIPWTGAIDIFFKRYGEFLKQKQAN